MDKLYAEWFEFIRSHSPQSFGSDHFPLPVADAAASLQGARGVQTPCDDEASAAQLPHHSVHSTLAWLKTAERTRRQADEIKLR